MDIHDMIVKCRFLLQKVNSNVYNSITDEEWCDALNITIAEFVRKRAFDPADNNRDDYELRDYADGIQSLIRNYTFNALPLYPYYTNARYADLSVLSNINGNRLISKSPLYSGYQYRIVTKYGSDDFTAYGAVSNAVGELFVANFPATVQPTMSTTGDGTILRYGLSSYTTDASILNAGINYFVKIGSVTFPVGYPAKVISGGVEYWLSGPNQNRTTDLVIPADKSFSIFEEINTDWPDNSILEEVSTANIYYKYISSTSTTTVDCNDIVNTKQVPNRLVKPDFAIHHKRHSRGSAVSSPLVSLEDNKLIIFDNSELPYVSKNYQFSIASVTVKYYKKPAIVSVAANISCDLDEIVHEEIVRMAVDTVNASIGSATYQTLKTETVGKTVQ